MSNSNLTFAQVLFTIKNTIPKLDGIPKLCYSVKDNPCYQITIARPCSFDRYDDIVAQVTLCKDNKVISDTLITIDTDLKKFCEKLSRKIKEI